MTIRVPNPRKTPAQLAMERAIAGADSISLGLRRALEGVGRALTQEPGVTQLSQISPALGDITSGAFWAMDDNGKPRLVMSAESLFEALGVNAYFAGLDVNGTPQFWMDADTGGAVFAGGAGVIDEESITMNGIRYALRHYATDPDGNNPRYGAFEMFYPDGSTIPALRLMFYDATDSSNLATNGDFETGDLTGWTKTETAGSGSASAAVTGTDPISGSYSLQLSAAASAITAAIAKVDSTNYITVDPSKSYKIRSKANVQSHTGNEAVYSISISWYTSGNVLISTAVLFNQSITMNGSRQIENVVNSPATAAKAKLALQLSATGRYVASSAVMLVDDISLQAVPVMQSIVLSGSGISLNGAVATNARRGTIFLNEFYSTPTLVETVSSSQPHGVWWGPTAANANDGDEYKAYLDMEKGTYLIDLCLLKFSSAGNFDLYLDSTKLNLTPYDMYAASTTYAVHQTLTGVSVAASGRHELRIQIAGKNASSSDYRLGGTCATYVRTGD